MKIFVSSRCRISNDIQKLKKENPNNKIISFCITDPKSEPVNIPLDESSILRLQFHDLDEKYPASSSAIVLFNTDMAQQIKDFMILHLWHHMGRHLDDSELIIFSSCEAGISRSSGLAAALSKHFIGNDEKFFKTPYLPNRLVYRTLLNLLNGQENPIPNVILSENYEDLF